MNIRSVYGVLLCLSSFNCQELFGATGCEEGIEFEFVLFGNADVNLEQARTICIDEGGSLASIRGLDEAIKVENFLADLEEDENELRDFYIGVVFDEESDGDVDDPGSYIFDDGFGSIEFFDVQPGQEPWFRQGSQAQPNDDDEETAVEYLIGEDRWGNISPLELRDVLCRRLCDFDDEDELEFNFAVVGALGATGMLNGFLVFLHRKEKREALELEQKIIALKTKVSPQEVLQDL
eukprot:augustus_masked-scaffold_1-processed-gene-4.2-mRNA-1 protein AED:1.00 eAED:1.00 QI:0/-1/0/0/-1/1/1/0/235